MAQLSRYPLPLTPDPSESLISIVHRLSEENGYKDALSIYGDARIHHLGQEIPGSKLDVIAARSGLDVGDLANRQTERCPDKGIRFLGTGLQPSLIERQRLKFCIRCLQEFGFHRLIWELAPINTCPLHQVALVRDCPSCGKPLIRSQKNIFICRKGHDLRAIHLALPGPIDGGACVALIYEKCGLGNLLREPQNMPSDFQDLPLGEFIDTLLLVGRIKDCILREKSSEGGASGPADFLRLAANAIMDWPEMYCADLASLRSLDRFMRSPADRRIHDILCYSLRRGIGKPIAKVTYEFALNGGFIFPTGAFGYRPESPNKLFLSVDAAAKKMGVDKRRVKSIAKQHHWPGWQGIAHANHCLLRASDVLRWSRDNWRLVTPNILAKQCGCSEELVRELVTSGVFGSAARDRCTGDRFSHKMITERELETFLAAISAAIYPAKGNHISWRGFKRIHSTPMHFADLVAAILERRIQPCSWDGRTLISMRYDREALVALARDFSAL